MDYKQAIVVRADLEMGKGKMVAQGSHASLMAYKLARDADASEWEESGSKKITLKVSSEAELLDVFMKAKAAKLPAALVKDAGHTQVVPGTPTAVAIGPAPEGEIDRITGGLKLL
jgi:PTH2 family peptidyl-tRNA hydrolase